MKKILIILAILVVLFIGGIIALIAFGVSQFDNIVKHGIERGGTYAMGVDTTIDTIDVGLTTGTVELAGLNIANPTGFDTEYFFALESSDASVDMNSISSDKIIIPSVNLTGLNVILDKGNNPSNYNQILENLKRFESDDTAPTDPKGGSGTDEGGKNVVIQSLVLQDIKIRVANMPGVSLLAGDVAVMIPEITLENIGEEESMNAGDIFNLVIKTVLAAAVEAGGGIIPGDVLGELGNGLAGLTSLSDMGIDVISDLDLDGALGEVSEQINHAIDGIGDDVTKQVDDVQDQVEDAVDDAADKLKNIFGGNDDP